MRLCWIGLVLVAASCAFGQRGPGRGGPIGGHPPVGRGGGARGSFHNAPRGAFRGGRSGFGGGFGYFGLPLSYPYYGDSFEDYAPEPMYAPPAPAPPAPPTVIVQQPPARPVQPVVREYAPPSSGAPGANEADSFAIVMKDGSVRSAAAVTVQDDTLHYVDPDGQHVRVPLDSVDRAATRRTNRERGLDLQLPAASR